MRRGVFLLAWLLCLSGCATSHRQCRRELARTDTFAARLADDLEVRFTDVEIVRPDSAAPRLQASAMTLRRSRRAVVERRAAEQTVDESEADSKPAAGTVGFTARMGFALGLLCALAIAGLARGRR